jgi:hypothetical protein
MSRLELPTVTVSSMATRDHWYVREALLQSQRRVRFRNAVVFTDKPGEFNGVEDITFIHIEPFATFVDICPWGMTAAPKILLGSDQSGVPLMGTHVLNIHWDGFVWNVAAWDARWLDKDFLGAMWVSEPVYNNACCLQTRRFLECILALNLPPTIEACSPADIRIAYDYRSMLETMGIEFPQREVCDKFSTDHDQPYVGAFGFHSPEQVAFFMSEGTYPKMPMPERYHE